MTGITVWREALEGRDPSQVGAMLRDSGLEIVSLCRSGFFAHLTSGDRQKAVDDNLRAIDTAADLGTAMLVLVCGAEPGQSLGDSRHQIAESLARILPHAEECQIRLTVEPLHPMYADNRSTINTLKQANDLCEALDSQWIGVAVDVYHLWWDPELQREIRRSGENGWLAAFHICDWKTPTKDLLRDRGLMGEGCIPIRQIRGWVQENGFNGFNEVEIFSERYWAGDQDEFLSRIVASYQQHC